MSRKCKFKIGDVVTATNKFYDDTFCSFFSKHEYGIVTHLYQLNNEEYIVKIESDDDCLSGYFDWRYKAYTQPMKRPRISNQSLQELLF